MIRSTTNGTLNTYRYNLQRSFFTLNQSINTVQTQRKFNSFAEDPAAAARAFQLRRSYLRTESQVTVGESVVKKYDMAWSTLDSVLNSLNQTLEGSAYGAIVKAESDTSGAGRNALGQSLGQMAENIVQAMNGRYGDNYVFSGADGLNIPFTWETQADGTKALCYRGISVDSTDPDDVAALDYMANSETKYEDLGLGLEVDAQGSVMDSSAINTALQGISFLGYGVDADGDPKNIASIMSRMSQILENCDADSGAFAAGEEDEFYRLAGKFETAASTLSDKHVELDATTGFIKSNQTQLESLSYTLNEQIVSLENVDMADAITSLSWAQYCYNAALQSGNSILSQSLMDYLHS